MQTSIFRSLHHVCVVVHDLEKTVAFYQSLGIDPWYDYPSSQPYIQFEVPNPLASKSMRYKCADLDNFQLQLCDPGKLDSPQRRFLQEHGEGVYHLGFEVADLAAAEAAAHRQGLGVIGRGLRADRSGFCYFDTRAQAGVVLEIRRSAPKE